MANEIEAAIAAGRDATGLCTVRDMVWHMFSRAHKADCCEVHFIHNGKAFNVEVKITNVADACEPELLEQFEDWQRARLGYTDAELYRVLAARLLIDGNFDSKAALDAWVRNAGDLEEADKIIAFNAKRPGCIANELFGKFECACGVKWLPDDPSPPDCKKELLK